MPQGKLNSPRTIRIHAHEVAVTATVKTDAILVALKERTTAVWGGVKCDRHSEVHLMFVANEGPAVIRATWITFLSGILGNLGGDTGTNLPCTYNTLEAALSLALDRVFM